MSMTFGGQPTGTPAQAAAGDLIKDSNTQNFLQDVIEPSRQQPVIVDFWAPWCGPCKQLGPALEKVVRAAGGKVRMVKINIDENQQLAQQMRIQSIPAVYAFKDGRPVDGFAGALPDSQVRQFVEGLAKLSGPTSEEEGLKDAMAQAEEMAASGDLETAIAIYAEVLAQAPTNVEAIAGLAKHQQASGDLAGAKETLATFKPEPNKAEPTAIATVRAAIELAEQSAGVSGEVDALAAKVAADPADHQARFDLAVAQFGAGKPDAAIDELLAPSLLLSPYESDQTSLPSSLPVASESLTPPERAASARRCRRLAARSSRRRRRSRRLRRSRASEPEPSSLLPPTPDDSSSSRMVPRPRLLPLAARDSERASADAASSSRATAWSISSDARRAERTLSALPAS